MFQYSVEKKNDSQLMSLKKSLRNIANIGALLGFFFCCFLYNNNNNNDNNNNNNNGAPYT